MSLVVRGALAENVFQLIGKDENSATFALGWALERSPGLAAMLAEQIAGRPVDAARIRVHLQASGEDRGFTDVEIRCGDQLHAIIEAKVGFGVPSVAQLLRYRPRFNMLADSGRALVSVSALPVRIAKLMLPADVLGVKVLHLSWGAIRGIAKQARSVASGLEERLWLRELIQHLEGYAAMDRTKDNLVYVVSLGSAPMTGGSNHTWIDVVEKDGCYFHPVGNHWPIQPPNYIGFRYRGKVQSVHRIERYEIVSDLSSKNPLWPATLQEHFVYKLGPAMRPALELRAGGQGDSVRRSARVVCAIDTLLSGEFKALGMARDETKRRLAEAEKSDE